MQPVFYSSNPHRDWENYCAWQEGQKLPTCAWCGEKITSERLYDFDGEYVCEPCIENTRRWTDSVMED